MEQKTIKTQYGVIKHGDKCPRCKGTLYINFSKVLICNKCSFMPKIEELFYNKHKRYPKDKKELNDYYWKELKQ